MTRSVTERENDLNCRLCLSKDLSPGMGLTWHSRLPPLPKKASQSAKKSIVRTAVLGRGYSIACYFKITRQQRVPSLTRCCHGTRINHCAAFSGCYHNRGRGRSPTANLCHKPGERFFASSRLPTVLLSRVRLCERGVAISQSTCWQSPRLADEFASSQSLLNLTRMGPHLRRGSTIAAGRAGPGTG